MALDRFRHQDPPSTHNYSRDTAENAPDARFRLRLGTRAARSNAVNHTSDARQPLPNDRSTSAANLSSGHGQYYRASPKSFSSPLVSSYIQNMSSRSHGRHSSSMAYSDDGRESVVSGAASTVWDDVDDVKSRLKRLETLSRNEDDVASVHEARSNTITTDTSASQPLGVTNPQTSTARTLTANALTSSPQRKLQASVARIHTNLSEDVFRALDSSADDAIALSGIADNLDTFTGISPEFEMNFRRLRRKADDLCRNMTELCSALGGEGLRISATNKSNHYSVTALPSHFTHTPIQAIVEERRLLQSRAESRMSVVRQPQLVLGEQSLAPDPRRRSYTARPPNPEAPNRNSAVSRTDSHLDHDLRPPSRAMTEYGAAYRSPRQARRPTPSFALQPSVPRTPHLEYNLAANRTSFESNSDINLLTPRPTPGATFAAQHDHARYVARPVSAASTSLAERVKQRRRERSEQSGDGYSNASVDGAPGLAR